ncbi:hypothetical protein BU24DRAFT_213451 [Aaosphaeria arxii CBS 175.79]|uniref:N-acetyltransferase domain-containing protein n=1 Tax=Aaosphaeria arxii CBS 175.79 TaxID=1450172 RepID=A0A6A5XM93_9PLEO|nr:uncharacterized protein BU24DRAFT_213451 [Aaosphaeria arxii CBS 175.79]KAF2014358.1 hypothetical protein BU24DRAFT_213451 [Aaosphaeria arxii CBS 175.79]
MAHKIFPVESSDIPWLVRHCDYPAMRENPLTIAMFPNSNPKTEEEEIMWHTGGLQDSFHSASESSWIKVCNDKMEPVGFAIWFLGKPFPAVRTTDAKRDEAEGVKAPTTLDGHAWRTMSDDLRLEKDRVLNDRPDVCRLTMLSVNPDYQRQGYGTSLVGWGCRQADRAHRTIFVMASPAAVGFYEKFGFKTQGQVWTCHGTFKSMLREPEECDHHLNNFVSSK